MERIYFTTYQISRICGVSTPTIVDWINSGKLTAYKTLGGHRRITKEDLIEFLKKNDFPIPKDLESTKSTFIKVLIVDKDHKTLKNIEKSIRNTINKYKYLTKTASDGFQAGQAISEFNPDLVVVNITPRDNEGLKICRSIHKRNKNIKILAIAAHNTEERKRKILKAGANEVLYKPFKKEALIKNIKKVFTEI
ncbi:MAG: response regulator [Endomicrobiales bacterium]|nr:response regulator [Endomicrobiales bacterium]